MSNTTNDTIFLTEQAKKRLIKDIVYIHKNPLTEQGIYYQHHDTDMLKGYAMIIGPKNTPYENGYYFFEFKFPYNYPIEPPKVTFKTKDKYQSTRFHPNLYWGGKVCLSILNTWRGEPWTSSQTISSILMTLVSILDENPLLHEPGYVNRVDSPKNIEYNIGITYKNFEIAIYDMLKHNNYSNEFSIFKPFMIQHFKDNYSSIIEKMEKEYEYTTKHSIIVIFISVYRDTYTLRYNQLIVNMKKLLDDFS